MKVLVDMNLSPGWVSFLAEADSKRSIGLTWAQAMLQTAN